MAVDYSKFDKMMDVEGLKKDVVEAKENSGNFKEATPGVYEVSIEKMELVESKTSGNPMVSIWFKILEGEFKNTRIFMNQVVTSGLQIHIMNNFLKSLGTEIDVEFENFVQYGNMILDIHEEVEKNFEYALNYGEDKNGYKTFKIEEVYELED